jgi:hypothetical protein
MWGRSRVEALMLLFALILMFMLRLRLTLVLITHATTHAPILFAFLGEKK